MAKRPRTPDRLTLLSLSTLLATEDAKVLESKVWDNIASRTWIAYAYAAPLGLNMNPFSLVEAESRDEALLKLFVSGFYRKFLNEIYDYCFCEDCQDECCEDCDHPGFHLFAAQFDRCADDPSNDTIEEIMKHVPRAEVIGVLKWWSEISMQAVYRLSDIAHVKSK